MLVFIALLKTDKLEFQHGHGHLPQINTDNCDNILQIGAPLSSASCLNLRKREEDNIRKKFNFTPWANFCTF